MKRQPMAHQETQKKGFFEMSIYKRRVIVVSDRQSYIERPDHDRLWETPHQREMIIRDPQITRLQRFLPPTGRERSFTSFRSIRR